MPSDWYDRQAAALAQSYEAIPPTPSQGWLVDLLPALPAVVIDIGAGTGRDARAFAAAGFDVVAIEPSAGMRAEAQAFSARFGIQWLSDSLPSLAAAHNAGLTADLICLSAVWQHVAPGDRQRAFRKVVDLLRSGGLLAMTVRHGPDDGRGAHPVSDDEVLKLARAHGMQVLRCVETPDLLGRAEIRWTAIVLRLPDDGTGALPLLRHLILADAKSATYKLGLLRALCRAADGSAGLSERREKSTVALPLGLVALIWLRLYLPLIRNDLPQAPGNTRGGDGLGFAGPGWRALAGGTVSDRDLRVGASFSGADAAMVHAAIQEAADLICRMPANFLTYPNGGRIISTDRRRAARPSAGLMLDQETLSSFGEALVPEHLWTALSRFSAWIEPSLIAEWSRLMRDYVARQGREVPVGTMAAAMTWSEPTRDVALTRSIALDLLDRGKSVHCVWSGKQLRQDTLDVDHCLPWSAWPCGDLWNLMPTDRQVNQRLKRERLPSAGTLLAAGNAIMSWWRTAYLDVSAPLLPVRFRNTRRGGHRRQLPGSMVAVCDCLVAFSRSPRRSRRHRRQTCRLRQLRTSMAFA